MLYKLTVRNPYKTPTPHWNNVPWLRSETEFCFQPGLNIIYGKNGCLDGSSFVAYHVRTPDGRSQNTKGGAIEHLYRRFHGIPTSGRGYYQRESTLGSVFYAPSIDENGRVFQNRVVDVVKTGTKPCMTITTAFGEITSTADHKFWTGERFVAALDLRVGDEVHVHNNTYHKKAEAEAARRPSRAFLYLKSHPVAGIKVITDRISGKKYQYYRVARARAVVEARMNGLSIEQYSQRLNEGHIEGMTFLRRDQNVHHLDEDCLNDRSENLVVVDHREHAGSHALERKSGRMFSSVPTPVLSIKAAGERETYDIKMESPFNNYVANGFVVHNSGKSTLLTSLARLLHVYETNWPRITKDSVMAFNRPIGYATGLLLEHDGKPARYMGVEDPDFAPERGVKIKALTLSQSKETASKALHNISHGQASVSKLIRFLKTEPRSTKNNFRGVAPEWREVYDVATESIKNKVLLPKMPRQQVILLDEVDRSLDFAAQISVFSQLQELAKKNQIIIASHSPFACAIPEAHYIETTPGYLDGSRQALSKISEMIQQAA